MYRWALRVAYYGKNYHGFQRQPNLPTIEGRLLDALHQANLVDLDNLKAHQYANAARTDRGVSALEQTIAFNAAQSPNLNQLNAYLPNSILLWAVSEVPQEFHPRNDCFSKTYVYYHYEGLPTLNLAAMQKSGELLEGTHDFRNFARYDPRRKQNFIRTLHSLEIIRNDPLLAFRFVGKAFLWEQCRRIVSHLLEVGSGRTELEGPNGTFQLLTNHGNMVKPAPAPPDGLMLFAVEYEGIVFLPNSQATSKKKQFLYELCGDQFRRYQVVEALQKRIIEL